jgi:type IV pilus assembly protein PilM
MRILGIDVGSRSVKAVEIDSAFGRYEIHEYHEKILQAGESSTQAVMSLLASLTRKPDRIVVSLITRKMTFRNLQLPTKDKKAILAAVGFELEDELPFPIEQAAYDYTVLSQNKQGAYIHVAATLERHVKEEIEQWNAANIDPDAITTEAWGYRTFLNRVISPDQQEQPIFLLQLGHEKSVAYLQWRGTPILAREIAFGGRDLTFALGQKLNIPLEKAEKLKQDQGFSPVEEANNATLAAAFEPFLFEIRQIELSCKNLTHERPSILYLTGGTSLLPGLSGWLEKILKIPVKNLQGLSSVATSGVTYSEQADALFLTAVSTALCQVGPDRSTSINFRKGLFSKTTKSRQYNLETIRKPLMYVGAVAATFIISMIVQSSVYEKKMTDTNTQLERSVRAFFGGQVSGSALKTYLNNTETLKTSVTKELNRQKELAKLFDPNPKSSIEFLRNISSAVPRDVVVDLIQYQVGSSAEAAPFAKANDDQSASLTFVVANNAAVERLSSILTTKLAGLQRSKVEDVDAVDGSGGKALKVTFTGKPTESAYGK